MREMARDRLRTVHRGGGDATLVQSGPTTRAWLRMLCDRLRSFEYREATYYASFRSDRAHGVFAYLNPAKYSIRLFVRLEPENDAHLTGTPSSHQWAARFPSIFTIKGESHLPVAQALIEKSYAHARTSS